MWEDTLYEFERRSREKGNFFDNFFIREKIDTILIFLIIVGSSTVVVIGLKLRIFHLWLDFLSSSHILRFSALVFTGSTVFIIAGILFRTFLWIKYRPLKLKPAEKIDWPYVSVIMPALNEEELIEKSIDCVFASKYPEENLELICINDGSADRTLYRMLKARQKYGQRLRVINFRKNVGKRKALYAGFKMAKGEIIVTSDSDSKIGRNAIRNVVLPLIKDRNTGAVAGRVAVLNEKENFLTRMLSIRYSISFDFGRAYQSVYGTVFCCPGALTAYRKSVLMKFAKDWVKQKFLDVECTYGEDRSLTTNILKCGYMTRYQSNAVVYTRVPSRLRQVSKMYLRWTRSYIRESVLFSMFMFSPYREQYRLLPICDFFFLNFLHPFHLFAIALVFYSVILYPVLIVRYLLIIVIISFFLSLYYLRTNRSLTFLYGIPYAVLTAFCLWWIVPYAACTLKNQSWLTK
ncbi:MAG: glycosyltransferase [Candidatus Hydrothermarchaeota archaeon]